MELTPASDHHQQGLIPTATAHAPGRVNLIGEHTDYNGGKVLPFAIPMALDMSLQTSPETTNLAGARFFLQSEGQDLGLSVSGLELLELVRLWRQTPVGGDMRQHLPPSVAKSWARYAVGALVHHYAALQGSAQDSTIAARQYINIKANLPQGAGVSSSAALCTGLLGLLGQSSRLPLDRLEVARSAMHIEHQFAGTRCGLMDQTVICLAEQDHLLLIDFVDLTATSRVKTRAIRPHPSFAVYQPILINTRVKHDLGSSPYNERRASCERGLEILQHKTGLKKLGSLGAFAADTDFIKNYAPDADQTTLHLNLLSRAFAGDDVLARRVAHAIMEVLRVDQAVRALETFDLDALSTAINTSHISLRDDFEVSCAELDMARDLGLAAGERLAQDKKLSLPGILGARMTGGGFGGSVIALVHRDVAQELVDELASASSFRARFGHHLECLKTSFCQGLTVSNTAG